MDVPTNNPIHCSIETLVCPDSVFNRRIGVIDGLAAVRVEEVESIRIPGYLEFGSRFDIFSRRGFEFEYVAIDLTLEEETISQRFGHRHSCGKRLRSFVGRHHEIFGSDSQLHRLPIELGQPICAIEIEIHGSSGLPPANYREIFDMVRTGKLDPSAVISETITLPEVNDTLEAMTAYDTVGIPVVTEFGH